MESEPVGSEGAVFQVDLVELEGLGSGDYHRDARWVYQHMAVADVKPDDAPTPGTWALLKWAKRNESRFFEQVMPKANAAKQGHNSLFADSDEPDPSMEMVQKYMDELFNSWEEHAIENVAQVVKDEIFRKIVEWQSGFKLQLPQDVLNSLTWRTVALADDLVHAALNNPEAFRNRPKGQARR